MTFTSFEFARFSAAFLTSALAVFAVTAPAFADSPDTNTPGTNTQVALLPDSAGPFETNQSAEATPSRSRLNLTLPGPDHLTPLETTGRSARDVPETEMINADLGSDAELHGIYEVQLKF